MEVLKEEVERTRETVRQREAVISQMRLQIETMT